MRTTLYNEKNKYQLRKIAEGLDNFNLVRVNNNNQSNAMQGMATPAGQNRVHTNGSNQATAGGTSANATSPNNNQALPPNNLSLMSP